MRRFSERERVQMALLWALLLALIYLLAVLPLLDAAYRSSRAEYERAERLLARMDTYHRADMENRERVHSLILRHAFLARALPKERAQGAFLHDAETYAQETGVTIEGAAQQPAEEHDGLVLLPIEMHLRGDYFAMRSFLRALQEGERAVQFGSLSLTAEGRLLSAVLVVKIASFPDDVAQEETSSGVDKI